MGAWPRPGVPSRRSPPTWPAPTLRTSASPSSVGSATAAAPPPTYSSSAIEAIARLPGVRHVEAAIPLAAAPLAPNDAPRLERHQRHPACRQCRRPVLRPGSPGRHRWTHGRPEPARRDRDDRARPRNCSASMSARSSPTASIRSGRQSLPGFGTARVQPRISHRRHVGGPGPTEQRHRPGRHRPLPDVRVLHPGPGPRGRGRRAGEMAPSPTGSNSTTATATSNGWSGSSPGRHRRGNTYGFHAIAPVEAKVDRTVKPLAIALGVFGGVAALAALLIGLQLISRQLRDAEEESAVLRASVPARRRSPLTGCSASWLRSCWAPCSPSVVAVALVPAVSAGSRPARLPRLGHRLRLDRARASDSPCSSSGSGRSPLALAYRGAPASCASPLESHRPTQLDGVVQAAASAGLPATGRDRGALRPRIRGGAATAVPVRSALFGAVLAVALIVATLTFGSWPAVPGLASGALRLELQLPAERQQHDAPAGARAARPRSRRRRLGRLRLQRRRDRRPRRPVPLRIRPLRRPKRRSARRSWPGTPSSADDQIVLGAATLAQLHNHIGDTVVVTLWHARRPRVRPADTVSSSSARPPCPPSGSRALSTTTPRWGPGRSCRTPPCPPAFRAGALQLGPHPQRTESRLRPAARRSRPRARVSPTCNASPPQPTRSSPTFPTAPMGDTCLRPRRATAR